MGKGLPNLVVAGVPKAGTTSLYAYLAQHPDVFAPKTKEIYYFNNFNENKELKDISEYKKHFLERGTEKYAIDATPNYFAGGRLVISKMKEILPEHKVIVILRNPVKRFVSLYNYLYSKGWIPDKDLATFLNKCIRCEKGEKFNLDYYRIAIPDGKYMAFLPEWFNEYESNFKILYFEDFIANPQVIMGEVAEWLSIDPSPFGQAIYSQENRTVFVRNKALHAVTYPIISVIKKNKSIKTFFKKNAGLKASMKNAYYKLNQEDVQKRPIEENTMEMLKEVYRESNEELFKYLNQINMKLPKWK